MKDAVRKMLSPDQLLHGEHTGNVPWNRHGIVPYNIAIPVAREGPGQIVLSDMWHVEVPVVQRTSASASVQMDLYTYFDRAPASM